MQPNRPWTRRNVLVSALAAGAVPWSETGARAQSGRRPAHIVDSQTHIWSGGKPSPTHRQEPFSKEQLLQEMSAAGVERALIITPSWNPDGNELPLAAARAVPDRLAVMGLFDTTKTPDPAVVENWNKRQGMLGIRLFLGSPQGRAWMSDGSADWFWPIAERAGIPLMIFAGGMMPDLARVATQHSGLKVCIDSFGVRPGMTGLASFADFDAVLALAKYPNVSIKAASLPFLSAEAYPYRNLHPILRRTYDAFGPERMFWGSDVTLLKTPYKECVTAFTDELPWLSDHDLDLIMGRAVSNWAGWPLPA